MAQVRGTQTSADAGKDGRGGRVEGGRAAVAAKLRQPRTTEPSHDVSHRSGRIVPTRQRD
ncbi:MAG: hypothetical protein ACYDC4_13455 [Candidatus Dormibacteria bacterium]